MVLQRTWGNMAYFLKKSTNKKGLYLQIYESFYDPARRQTAHRSVEALGYEHELRQAGIADPVAHFKAKVDSMNAERRARKIEERACLLYTSDAADDRPRV